MYISNKGIYILELFAEKNFLISAEKFKDIIFPKGFYYYIGSAQKNLKSRIERHLRKAKIIHWHIDHLTAHKSTNIVNIFILLDAEKTIEAEIANKFVKYFNSDIIVEGFGNSDINETKTHLFYKNESIKLTEFQTHYQTLQNYSAVK